MKFRDAMYAWTPATDTWEKSQTAGQIMVGPHPDRSKWSKPFSFTGGSCFLDLKTRPEIEQVMQIFIDFHTIVVRDGIDPNAAHREFLKIDEYRERISPDISGAEVN